jgi:hypothetical protein
MNPFVFRLRNSAGATLAVVILSLLFSAPAHAGRNACRTIKHRPAAVGPTRSAEPLPVAVPSTPVSASGMVVAVDPETGALVPPTAAQVRALMAMERTGLMRTSEGLTEVRLPNGAVVVDLQGRFMEFTVVRRDLQGRLHFLGVNEAPAALRLLDPRTPDPAPTYEER